MKKKTAIKQIVDEAKKLNLKDAVKKTIKDLDKAGNEPMQRHDILRERPPGQ